VVIFLVDARAGVNAHDHEIAQLLRKTGSRIVLAVNKAEGMRFGSVTAEFHELGLGEPHPISASHGDGVVDLIEMALSYLDKDDEQEAADDADTDVLDLNDANAAFDDDGMPDTSENGGQDTVGTGVEQAVEHRIKL